MNSGTRILTAVQAGIFFLVIVFGIAILAYRCTARADDLERIPDEAVVPIFADVARILNEQGYAVRSDTVPVYFKRLSGVDGMTVAGAIVINNRIPHGCWRIVLGHEVSHLLLGRDIGMTPNQSEPIARAMERLVSHDYTPNCWSPAL